MPSTSDAARFVEHWTDVWRELDPDRFPELFHSEGTLYHPTMSRPITSVEEPAYVAGLKQAVEGLKLVPTRWGETEDGVLIEWQLTGTLADKPLDLRGADRFTLRGAKAVEGIAYFDTYPIWAALDPEMERDEAIAQLPTVPAGR
jgi:SnoaL-like domain